MKRIGAVLVVLTFTLPAAAQRMSVNVTQGSNGVVTSIYEGASAQVVASLVPSPTYKVAYAFHTDLDRCSDGNSTNIIESSTLTWTPPRPGDYDITVEARNAATAALLAKATTRLRVIPALPLGQITFYPSTASTIGASATVTVSIPASPPATTNFYTFKARTVAGNAVCTPSPLVKTTPDYSAQYSFTCAGSGQVDVSVDIDRFQLTAPCKLIATGSNVAHYTVQP